MKPYFAFQWHITDTCDQRCRHCYIYAEDNCKTMTEMPFDKMTKVLESCQDMCEKLNRTPYFYITGGDPILHKDFWKLAGLFRSKGIVWGILGNPFHLNDEVCRKLYEHGCRKYQLSLDGKESTHDMFRKKGSFQTTVEKIDCIKNSGMFCAVMATVSSLNMNEFPEITDLVAEKNVDVFAFGRYCPTSRQKSEEYHITPLEYRDFLDRCYQRFQYHKKNGCKTTFQYKDHLWTLYLYEKGLFKIPENNNPDIIYDGCHCGTGHMTILPTGDIYACRRMESKIGNVFETSMYDLFMGDSLEEYRMFDKFEKCSKCELKGYCRGCPAVTFGYTNNMYAPDPQCWKEGVIMDYQTCLKKLRLVGVLNFATVDEEGFPQVRNISAVHYDDNALYFFTARGKEFCRQLLNNGKVQISAYTKFKESIRLSGKAFPVPEEEQIQWRDKIFEEQPYLENVYPKDTKNIGIIFCIKEFSIEYFNLGVYPIYREVFEVSAKAKPKGFEVGESCIGCETCISVCPQRAVDVIDGKAEIRQKNCLHCGNCFENCPVQAISRR